MDYAKKALILHKKHCGKIELKSKVRIKTKNDLSICYTPGVAAVSRLIAKDQSVADIYTIKGNTVAVITDGSAVLGLGNIGPLAAMPVMEGKAMLFKEFAGVDAFPICLGTQNADEIVKIVKAIAPGFGGINLEDISAPRCFEIEERLKKELDIPVFHDDQHGSAIVVLAALTNALKVVGKKINEVKIIINGAGAAALTVANFLIEAGANKMEMAVLDSKGTLYAGRDGMNYYKTRIAEMTNGKRIKGTLQDVIKNADVFVGMSARDVLLPGWVNEMGEKPIVFAMANPEPEISYEKAKKTKIAVFGTGRSDYPNQINNVLAFPGVFRGALDAKAREITGKMKFAAAKAISEMVPKGKLSPSFIMPSALNRRVAASVAKAVAKAA